MSGDFIPALAAIEPSALAPLASPTPAAAPGGSFGTLVGAGLRKVDAQLQASEVDLRKLATGDVQNLHQIMIRMEEARLSFQLVLQIRNRLLESYQDVMRMQV